MSYILDALKRADADRERGQVPSLHSQSPIPVAADRSRRRLIAVGFGLALLAAVGLAVFWFRGAGQTAVPSPISADDPQPVAVASAAKSERAAVASATASAPPPQQSPPAPILAPAPPPPKPAPKRAVQASTAEASVAGLPPGITVSGASYSENPEHRMLIVNGKVVHEGQDIQPGLRVEAIGAHTAVLKHDGTFYNIRY